MDVLSEIRQRTPAVSLPVVCVCVYLWLQENCKAHVYLALYFHWPVLLRVPKVSTHRAERVGQCPKGDEGPMAGP